VNLEQLDKSGYIIYKCISGSTSYGTNTPESDLDIRGVFRFPKEKYLTLKEPLPQISDESNDITFYSLKRFFELIKTANPNMIELLWIPDDCVEYKSPIMQKIIDNRLLFISKKAYYTHSAYAYAQTKRSKGANKWVNNPKSETPPDKMDFCWVIPFDDMKHDFGIVIGQDRNLEKEPFRPVPLKSLPDFGDLKHYHVAGLERVPNVFRLYYYGDSAKGVFRGEYQQLVCESIPKDDEWGRLKGLLIYNVGEYEKAKTDWKNYWSWRKERNESRYRSQEAGEIDYDSKNLLHTFRLLYSGKNILINGEPIVRFSGEPLKFLKDIRAGKFSHEYLMELAEKEMSEMEELLDKTSIPHNVNEQKIEKLYEELINM